MCCRSLCQVLSVVCLAQENCVEATGQGVPQVQKARHNMNISISVFVIILKVVHAYSGVGAGKGGCCVPLGCLHSCCAVACWTREFPKMTRASCCFVICALSWGKGYAIWRISPLRCAFLRLSVSCSSSDLFFVYCLSLRLSPRVLLSSAVRPSTVCV